ncbi:hypothetical protein SAMN04487897_11339 [Paenibacillus sp. yr247]|uniref:hypothetical protein n=1 Tax=Paenibacillus sp. yr247 TaxID=1761880 RepID=UPI0008855886|nr:hypothetical protein [Paenibacillus sp. yr247]SDO38463.1 hypothetical protein SAMN04487897_11339 [Paenibacillus sp. yr247]
MQRLVKSLLMNFVLLCLFLAAALPASAASSEPGIAIGLHPGTVGCPPGTEQPALSALYKNRVVEALTTSQDVYGQQILAKPEGPTYDNVKDFFTPIMYAIAPAAQGGFLTDTGVYYIPFGQPQQLTARGDLALTVADGSQIISNKADNLSTRIFVGAGGQEQFGSCLANLSTPALYKGYLPILQLQYRDHDGIEYQQESLATNLPGTDIVASYVEITADRDKSGHKPANIRFQVCSSCNLHQEGNQLVDEQGRTYLYFSPGATLSNSDLVYNLDAPNNENNSVYIVRPVTPIVNAPAIHVDKGEQKRARVESAAYWENRLSEGRLFQVPESNVMDAQRNLLIQDLQMTWRYSLGNAYEAFYQPESSSTMGVLGRYGFTGVYKRALQDLLPLSKGSTRRNWEIGEKLSHAADYYRLTGDSSLIIENLAAYKAYAVDLATQHAGDPNHLLARQQYSSDVKGLVYGLHQIGTALFGLQNMVSVWRELGETDLADKYAPIADDLRVWFDKAIKQSSTVMPDGSLFTQVMLLDKEEPYDHLPTTVLGSYWNLVAHYGFSAQVYAPESPEAKATLQYLYNHGARLLGLLKVRDGAINDVYETEQAKFLADNDQSDQLVLSLYNQLAHGMTRNTFITGEAASVGPLASKWPLQFGACEIGTSCTPPSFENGWAPNEYYRGMYLSPNTANNGFFLQLLRLMLINEMTNNKGEPQSLQLAFSTPRGWLENGKKIQVHDAPSLFGPISYTITSKIEHNQIMADLDVPSQRPIGNLQLRLRIPAHKQLIGVEVNGCPYTKFNSSTETIDLTGLTGKLIIRADYR